EKIEKIFKNPNKPLFNRAVTGQYPPGSTIKPILSLWALEKGYITPSTMIFDPGYYKIAEESKVFRDWKRDGHGWVNVNKAIRESCTTFFYHLSRILEIDEIHKCFDAFGLGKSLDIGLTNTSEGIAPSKEWKAENIKEPWYPGETLNTGIGQGYTLMSPLQAAYMTSIIANRGEQTALSLFPSYEQSGAIKQLAIFPNSKHWKLVVDSMQEVITHKKGTAYKINRLMKYPTAGKTGTSQVHTITKRIAYDKIPIKLRDHSWFIAFAPAENPKIAVAVILEHDRGSAKFAASVINNYLNKVDLNE
ncbi:MAG: penicillin-binding protein 2, partial [Francisellaceae bacterium]|nr:penicillin-binding protein 2 [Francisellaceae bacterium]